MCRFTGFLRDDVILCSCSTKSSQSPALRLLCSFSCYLTKAVAFEETGKCYGVHSSACSQWEESSSPFWSLRTAPQAHVCFVPSPAFLFSRLHVFYLHFMMKKVGLFFWDTLLPFEERLRGRCTCLCVISDMQWICKLFALQKINSLSVCLQGF